MNAGGVFLHTAAAVAVAGVALTASGAGAPAPSASAPTPIAPVVNRYCVTCHNDRAKTGGLSLQGVDDASLPQHAPELEKAVRKLRIG
ncbi:MAG TPA: hypothetical protein VG871_05470, partial [Vicinamibacterales bacterium]|nr:hypothetical protein [Vicinamibacterales bacterium]